MPSRIALATLVLGTLAACSPLREPATGSLGELGRSLARSLCPGTPARVESVRNLHVPGQIDRLETRRCEAGASTLYVGETTSDPEGLALAVEVMAPASGLPPHLEIGQPIQRALQVLGPPREQNTDSATYGLSIEGNDLITLRHSAGRIVSVQWAWVVD